MRLPRTSQEIVKTPPWFEDFLAALFNQSLLMYIKGVRFMQRRKNRTALVGGTASVFVVTQWLRVEDLTNICRKSQYLSWGGSWF
jgi:hypothetical protein